MTLKDIVLTKFSNEDLNFFVEWLKYFKSAMKYYRMGILSDRADVIPLYDNVKGYDYMDNVGRFLKIISDEKLYAYNLIEDTRDGSLKLIIGASCEYYNGTGVMMNICIDENNYVDSKYLYMNASEITNASLSLYAVYDKVIDKSSFIYLHTISKKQDINRDNRYSGYLSDILESSSDEAAKIFVNDIAWMITKT